MAFRDEEEALLKKLKDKPGVRDRLLRAVPAVTLALDTLAEAFK
jgi:hypothetical protein